MRLTHAYIPSNPAAKNYLQHMFFNARNSYSVWRILTQRLFSKGLSHRYLHAGLLIVVVSVAGTPFSTHGDQVDWKQAPPQYDYRNLGPALIAAGTSYLGAAPRKSEASMGGESELVGAWLDPVDTISRLDINWGLAGVTDQQSDKDYGFSHFRVTAVRLRDMDAAAALSVIREKFNLNERENDKGRAKYWTNYVLVHGETAAQVQIDQRKALLSNYVRTQVDRATADALGHINQRLQNGLTAGIADIPRVRSEYERDEKESPKPDPKASAADQLMMHRMSLAEVAALNLGFSSPGNSESWLASSRMQDGEAVAVHGLSLGGRRDSRFSTVFWGCGSHLVMLDTAIVQPVIRWNEDDTEPLTWVDFYRKRVEQLQAFTQVMLNVITAESLCHDGIAPVVCTKPVPMGDQVDLTLDLIAGYLKWAIRLQSPRGDRSVTTPLVRRPQRASYRPLGQSSQQTAKSWSHTRDAKRLFDAAEWARLAWDLSRSMQSAAVDGEIILDFGQKQRLKAFGHWSHWLQQIELSWNTYLRYQRLGSWETRALLRPPELPELPDPPGEPLLRAALEGPISDFVEPPPIRALSGPHEAQIYVDEMGNAYVKSLAELTLVGVDLIYFKGYMLTAIGALQGLRERDIGTVLLAVLARTQYGPYAFASYFGAIESMSLYDVYKGRGGYLPWEQHVSNWATLINLGLAPFARPSTPKASPRPGKGMYEGANALNTRYNGKSYKIGTKHVERRSSAQESGTTYAEVEFANSVPVKGGPPKVNIERKTVKLVEGKRGPLFFDPKTNEPIIPAGEAGYHLWAHLMEMKLGQKTGFTSLRKGFKDTPHEKTLNDIATEMRNSQGNHPAAIEKYVKFWGDIIRTGKYARFEGQHRFAPNLPLENFHQLAVPSQCTGRTEYIQLSIHQNGQLMNVHTIPHGRVKPGLYQSELVAPHIEDWLYSLPAIRTFIPDEWMVSGAKQQQATPK